MQSVATSALLALVVLVVSCMFRTSTGIVLPIATLVMHVFNVLAALAGTPHS